MKIRKLLFSLFLVFSSLFLLASHQNVYAASPTITIYDKPGCGNTYYLMGTVSGVTFSNYNIVLYLFVNGGWWVKPAFDWPLTPISSLGTWYNSMITGGNDANATQYAVFLIPKTYSPPLLGGSGSLPQELYTNSVANLLTDRTCPTPREIQFSGYTWQVKSSLFGTTGPGPNYFSDDPNDVFVDSLGKLHLKIVNHNGVWYSTEVINKLSLGYGKYTFTLDHGSKLDPSTVLGLFTWDNTSSAYSNREIDIEYSQWNNPNSTYNSQFVVQPYNLAGNMYTFYTYSFTNNNSLLQTINSFDWNPSSIYFNTTGVVPFGTRIMTPVTAWTYSGASVPPHGNENARMNLWQFMGVAPASGTTQEVVISSFSFTPNQMKPLPITPKPPVITN